MTTPTKEAAIMRKGRTTSARQGKIETPGKPEPKPAVIVQKRDFVSRVAEAAGVSRAQARPVVEAALEQLGRAIAAGETLALPPFGRARVARQHDTKGGEVIVVKLRRPMRKDPLSN